MNTSFLVTAFRTFRKLRATERAMNATVYERFDDRRTDTSHEGSFRLIADPYLTNNLRSTLLILLAQTKMLVHEILERVGGISACFTSDVHVKQMCKNKNLLGTCIHWKLYKRVHLESSENDWSRHSQKQIREFLAVWFPITILENFKRKLMELLELKTSTHVVPSVRSLECSESSYISLS